MIEKLRKERKTIWHISIVLMMMLTIVFLVAPANAVTCGPKYSPYHKVIDSVVPDTWDRVVFTYRIPQLSATIRIHVEYTRDITTWHNERTKTPRSWCTVNRRCEISGDPEIQRGTSGRSYSRWRATSYWIEET